MTSKITKLGYLTLAGAVILGIAFLYISTTYYDKIFNYYGIYLQLPIAIIIFCAPIFVGTMPRYRHLFERNIKE